MGIELLNPTRARTILAAVLLGMAVLGVATPSTAETISSAQTVSSAQTLDIGARVSAIELRLDAPLGRRVALEPLLAMRPGSVLTEQAIRRTLTSLQATGLFSEVEILTRRDALEADDAAGTLEPNATVVVVLRTLAWVSSVELRGELGLPPRTLLKAISQKEASPLVEDRVLESVYDLKDLYVERGYREAEVRVDVVREHGKQVSLVFELTSGPRAVVGQIELEGDTRPFQRGELVAAMRLAEGAKYDRDRITSSVRKLRTWLARRGHLNAQLTIPRETYDPESHRMHLTYPLVLGAKTRVEVIGSSLRRLKRKGFLPFLKEGTLDELTLDQHCGRIVEHLQRKGHYRATVDWRIEQHGDDQVLTIEIDRGKVYRLATLELVGNQQAASEDLLTLMSTSVRQPLNPGSGRLVSAELEEDLDNLRSYYLLHGFGDIEIGTLTVSEDRNLLELEIEIREGRQQRLVDFTFSGVELLDLDLIRADLPLTPGGPFHPVLLDDSVNIIRALYEEQGFPSLSITPRLNWNDELTLVDVHLEIEEGPQAVVDRLILRGQRRSKSEVIKRLIRLEEGDPISRRRLLEVERDLYRLGIFSKVDVDQQTAAESFEKRDVVVRLEEGQRYRLAYGFSYHSDDGLGGLLSVTRTNIGGRGDRLQLELRGNEADSTLRLLYDQPLLWRLNVPITYSLFGQTEDRGSFSVRNLGAQVALTKDLPAVRLRGVLEYRSVDITSRTAAFDDLDPNNIVREDREVEIFSLIPIFYVDRRDDPLDPQTGWSSALQLEYALPLGDAETHFLKLFWQNTRYFPLGKFGSLAASWRLGTIEPLDSAAERDPLVPADLPNALVPASERFFAGGRTSHRAYERDRLGILGETLFPAGDELIETGGNGLAVFNLDYRFPISGPVGGVVFFDYGNVWADWSDFDVGDLKPGAGLGVRYTSPIGPIRLEIGWKFDAEPQDDDAPVFFLSFGNPF